MQTGSQDTVATQSCLFTEFQASERLCLKETKWTVTEEQHSELISNMQAYICRCTHVNIHALVGVTIAVMKHHDQSNLRRKEAYHCLSMKEVRTGTRAGQDLGGRSWCRGHGGCCLLTCSSWLAQPAFL